MVPVPIFRPSFCVLLIITALILFLFLPGNCNKEKENLPVDNDVSKLLDNGTDTVVDITIWGTDILHLETSDILDGLLGPLQLSNDLLVGEGGEGVVGPGVGGNVMALVLLTFQDGGVLDDVGAHDEESGLDIVGLEGVQQLRSEGGGTWNINAIVQVHVRVVVIIERGRRRAGEQRRDR